MAVNYLASILQLKGSMHSINQKVSRQQELRGFIYSLVSKVPFPSPPSPMTSVRDLNFTPICPHMIHVKKRKVVEDKAVTKTCQILVYELSANDTFFNACVGKEGMLCIMPLRLL